jgi:hypothetical protein
MVKSERSSVAKPGSTQHLDSVLAVWTVSFSICLDAAGKDNLFTLFLLVRLAFMTKSVRLCA